MECTDQRTFTGFGRLRLFLALSRTTHGLLDMAAPAFAALLWLGRLPDAAVTLVGLVTTFAGYTAVYALNDVVGFRSDRLKFLQGGFGESGCDIDAVFIRHPMAQGYLSLTEGTLWAATWGVVALAGAIYLNPVCILIFLAGCLLEALYCLLWRVSPYRALVSGGVKTLGAVAAVFAVDPRPDPVFVALLFGCLFAWEIGGQNVPNDWADLAEDRRFGGKTIPIRFGLVVSNSIILWSNAVAVVLCGALFRFAGGSGAALWGAIAVTVAVCLLIVPAVRLTVGPSAELAMKLFNRASYFPLSLLCVAVLRGLFS
ncbi:MAG: UbiA family prenyltransferase [Pseudomonadota bacterium]